MILRLKRLRSGSGIFVQIKPFPVNCAIGATVPLEDKDAYWLLNKYGDMFEQVQPPEKPTVSRSINCAPNKSMDSEEKAVK